MFRHDSIRFIRKLLSYRIDMYEVETIFPNKTLIQMMISLLRNVKKSEIPHMQF